ncbi:MAG TPA: ATP-binding protein, partial [Acidimicrobiales bacterium]|nr:ATP-binding protein [Acidimicrobiales bacterium]
ARAGVGVGLLLSAARAGAAVVTGAAHGQVGRVALATASTSVSWVVFGAVCGAIVHLLRRTQHQLAAAEVREQMARDLHDGVLQTLALIERRSSSPDISRLAREQERELRAYLFDQRRGGGSLTAQLRTIAARLERAWPETTVTVTVTGDAPELDRARLDAVIGATLEALTNAAKHGRARHATVFADLDEATGGLFLSVKDDGDGFDAGTVTERVGMSQSIRGRVEEVGGRVEFASTPGDGTDVRIAFPSIRRTRTAGHA